LLSTIEHPQYLPIFKTEGLKIKDYQIEVREIRCSSLLHKLNFGVSFTSEYTINLYRGCTLNCSYCYAPSLIHDERQWGSYVDAKINAPNVLEKELAGTERDVVFISSASDPYQVVESRYRITRRCLVVLHKHQFPILILTRSPLVIRDLDILRKFEWVRVGFSISSLSDQSYEPGVPKLEVRLKALRKLKEAKIKTWISLAPIVPGIKLIDFKSLFAKLKEAGISAISLGVLRFTGYEASKIMFEKRTGIDSTEALANGVEIIGEVEELAESAGLDISCRSLEWRQRLGQHGANGKEYSSIEHFF
jgi:DNA repair photolyase